jgi:hypothetical protein|tara:strand:- start:653 stop:814 length:162 start_codon:yes stop_codon:yes gene_type:complete
MPLCLLKFLNPKPNIVVQGVTIVSVMAGAATVAWKLEQNRELVRLADAGITKE